MNKIHEIHVISGTHWDREWRLPFQRFRMMLVDTIDHLLEIMDKDPDYKYFHLDGQAIVLEDYLELRPENRQRLKKYIETGRILVGPWYTLIDQFCVSGESIIRNLLCGYKVAKEFGRVMEVGYTPSSFCGHVSQLPQIYAGFGIDAIIIHRGINDSFVKSEFIWESPDGTQALVIKHPDSYKNSNFHYIVFRPLFIGKSASHDLRYEWNSSGIPFHLCDENSYQTVASLIAFPLRYDPEEVPGRIQDLKEDLAPHATTPYLLCMDQCDHITPNPYLPEVLKEANKHLADIRVIHSNFPDFVGKVKSSIKRSELKVWTHELTMGNKEGGMTGVSPHVISSRVYQKQANRRVQIMLEKLAEPFSSLAWVLGKKYPHRPLELAWKYLHANHAHDSIGGCSPDEVHKAVDHRFLQIELITDEVFQRSLQHIITQIDYADLKKDDIVLTVFNPLPYERTEVVTAYVDFPVEWRTKDFVICDSKGSYIPHQVISKTSPSTPPAGHDEADAYWIQSVYDGPNKMYVDRFKVNYLACSIPSLGYKSFIVRRITDGMDSGKRDEKMLVVGPNTMENEFLKVKINDNGTLEVTDKVAKRVYNNLNSFEDGGDMGQGWNYIPPVEDKIMNSLNSKATISLAEENPLSARFKVEIEMHLPASASSDKRSRSDKLRDYLITCVIGLKKDSKVINISAKVDNNIRDHRLRAIFPSGIDTEFSYAEGHFDVLKRAVKLPDTTGWFQKAAPTHPQQTFVDLTDGRTGLAIINRGLLEYEVIDDKDRTVALTLLRSVGPSAREDLDDEGGQCLGEHEFRYAIYPHQGDWQTGGVFEQAYQYNMPLKIVQSKKHSGSLPKDVSFIRIGPSDLILSAVKKAEDRSSVVIRVFNPTDNDLKGKIWFCKDIEAARLVSLNEEPQEQIKLEDNDSLFLDVGSKKIISVELSLKGME